MKKFVLAAACLLIFLSGFSQTADKARLENERKAIQKELTEIQTVYNKVKGQKKETLGQLNLLQRKVNLQGKYIGNINREIRLINDDIYNSSLEVLRLQRQLDTLKAQYAKSVVYAYKNKSTYDYLNFIFSASNFNDALKRIGYLKSYRSYRQQQVANILETQKQIQDRKQQLLGKKTQKSSALQNQTKQMKVLEEQKNETNAVVSKLKSQEKDLLKQISARKKRDQQLKNQIAAVIRREIDAAKKEAAKRAAAEKANADNTAGATTATTTATPKPSRPASENNYLTLNEGERKLAASFEKNRGSLPWPVDNGFVCIHYGTYNVPGTLIKGDNPGITICTPSAGTTVKAVFDGEVSAVSNLGDGYMVMVRHGKYFTIYSNLASASVSKGATVRTGQSIGRAAADDEGGSGGKVEFLLMNEMKNVNPEPWLK